MKAAIEHHDAMIAAIEAHDADGIVDLTIEHWNLSRDRLERFVTPDPLPLDVLSKEDRANAV